MRRGALAATLLLPLAAACGGGDEDFVPIGTLETALEAGAGIDWLNVRNTVGSLRVTPAADERVSVRAEVSVRASLKEKHPSAELARDLEVKLEKGAVTIRSPHAEDGGRSDWKLDLAIAAPPRLHWTLVQVVGDLHVEAADTDVAASVAVGALTVTGTARNLEVGMTTGDVRVDVKALRGGSVHASTGQVTVRIADSAPIEPLSLTTTTGAIDLELPHGAAASVDLSAPIGDIEVEGAPELEVARAVTGERASGSIGGGGPRIAVSAGIGGIRFTVRR